MNMTVFYICFSYFLIILAIFVTIYTKTSLSAYAEYDFIKKHKILTLCLVILGLIIILSIYFILDKFKIPFME